MATEWQIIGIRVPKGNDLPLRFKEMSERSRLSYCELLEKLMSQATDDPEPVHNVNSIAALEAKLEARIKALEAQFEGLAVSLSPSAAVTTPSIPAVIDDTPEEVEVGQGATAPAPIDVTESEATTPAEETATIKTPRKRNKKASEETSPAESETPPVTRSKQAKEKRT